MKQNNPNDVLKVAVQILIATAMVVMIVLVLSKR